MKFSLVENDKSTVMDEVILAIIIFICLVAGVLLIVLRPAFWIFEQSVMVVIGIMFVIFGVMFIPSLIYRLITNDRSVK